MYICLAFILHKNESINLALKCAIKFSFWRFQSNMKREHVVIKVYTCLIYQSIITYKELRLFEICDILQYHNFPDDMLRSNPYIFVY